MRWLVVFSIVLGMCGGFAQEPTGGIITDLVFFDDEIHPKVGMGGMWMFAHSSDKDNVIKRNGKASYKYVNGGGHHLWLGVDRRQSSWSGPDTAVFWIQPNSRLQFWVRASSSVASIEFELHGDGFSTVVYPSTRIGAVNTWHFVDHPVPASARSHPLKNLKMMNGGINGTIWLDDLKLTNVRLHAGGAIPTPAQMEMIAASQVGYAPGMVKQFSSPVPFSAFQVKRVSDDKVVFNGGAPVKNIISPLIGNRSVWIGDFSPLSSQGRFKIVAGGKESYPFTIGEDVFDAAVRAAQRMFYFQRAFTEVKMPYAEGPWVHASDAHLAPKGVVGGWHDAGDLTIYFPTVAQTIQHLLDAWSDFKPMSDSTNIPESGNGIPDLLDEARWGLNWVLSMQDPSGGFWTINCANAGNQYTYGKNPPKQGTRPTDVGRYTKLTLGTPSTAKAIAVLGYAAVVFREFDSPFSGTCLAAARRGWEWLKKNPAITPDKECNAYPTDGNELLMRTQKMWAAAALFYATGEKEFGDAFEKNFENVTWIPSYGLTHAYAASIYLRAPKGSEGRKAMILQQFESMAGGVIADGNSHPFGVGIHYYWGSLNNALQRTANFSWKVYLKDRSRVNDLNQGLANVHYTLGRNFLNKCYVSGLPGVTNGMKESFHFWLKALNATPRNFPGMMGAGPNENPPGNDQSYPDQDVYGYFGDPRQPKDGTTPLEGRYTDNDSWSTNEQVISWNAVLLYNLYAAQMVARSK